MPIVPDDKDWTWVLERPCPECGFDAAAVASRVRGGPAARQRRRLAARAAQPDDVVRRRPADDRWSPLEYACHVRDVCALYTERLVLMLREDDPLYPNWDQDVTAVEARYGEQDPAVVSAELAEAAAALADGFDGVRGEQWLRPGRRSDGARFDHRGIQPLPAPRPGASSLRRHRASGVLSPGAGAPQSGSSRAESGSR